jgi:uncharacterized protein with FMN-binding domain
MRRAVIATVGTVVGLAALLSYKSAGTVSVHKVQVGGTSGTSGGTTATTVPATGSATTTSSPASTDATRTYVGDDVAYRYGQIEVAVTVRGSKILDISLPENSSTDPHSAAINSEAVPVLEQEAISAQGMDFDAVSGATFTSDAFAQSLESALDKAAR